LYLRIVGTERQGQVVRLSAPKCTIGSAEGCTLRLRAVGIHPLHCIILRGSRGTAIRCWSGDTRLNGLPFSDSLLEPGDRLSIGPVAFDVLDAAGCAEAMPSQNDRGTIVRPPSPTFPRPQYQGQRARVGRQRARKLVAIIKQLRAEVADLQSRPHSPPPETTELESRRRELEQRIAEFQQERDKWESVRQGTETALEARDRELAEKLAGLATVRETLRREREAAELVRAHASPEQNEQAENRRRLQEEMRLARDAFEQQRGAWAMENAQLHAQLENEQAELLRQREEAARILKEIEQQREQRQSEFQSQLDELEREQRDWAVRRAAEESRLAEEQGSLERQREEILREKSDLRLAQEAAAKEGERMAGELEQERQLWTAERSHAETHWEIQTSLVARQQAELAALRTELEDAKHAIESRQAEADRAAAELLVAAQELDERANDFTARQAAAWRDLDQQRARTLTLEVFHSEPSDEWHIRAAEVEAARRDLEQRAEELSAGRAMLDQHATELAEREARLDESAISHQAAQREIERLRCDLEADRVSILDACLAVQQQAEVLEAQRLEVAQQREVLEQARSQAVQRVDSLASLENERALLAEERKAWDQRQSEAEDRLTARAAELDVRERALEAQSASTETVVNVPATEVRDWEAHRAQFEQERQVWQEARERGDADYSRQLEQFEEQLETLRHREAQLESERVLLAGQHAEHEQREELLRELSAELEAKEQELSSKAVQSATVATSDHGLDQRLAAQQAEIEQAREQLQRDREELETERAHARAHIERRQAELEELRDELEEARRQVESSREAGQRSEVASSTIEEDQDLASDEDSTCVEKPSDETAALIDEEDPGYEEDEMEEEAPVADSPARSQRTSVAADASSDETSIDDYMAALLKRMRGGAPSEPVVVAPNRSETSVSRIRSQPSNARLRMRRFAT
jgi:hypothetical protein